MFYNIVKGQLLWVRCPMLHFFVTLCREYNKCSLIFLKQRIRLGNAGKQIELCFFAMHSTFAIFARLINYDLYEWEIFFINCRIGNCHCCMFGKREY